MPSYKIAHVGLKKGLHTFQHTVDAAFFAQFDYEFPPNDSLNVTVLFDKNKDHLFNLTFQISGKVAIECDRCLATLQLPVQEEYDVIVKMVSSVPSNALDNDDTDIIYITPDMAYIDTAQLIYEFVLLSIPLHAAFPEDDYGKPTCPKNEDGSMPCNEKVLTILHQVIEPEESDDTDDNNDNTPIDPRWAALKNLKK